MIVTAGLKPEGMVAARETGVLPDFAKDFADVSDVRLVKVFGRGRFANLDVTDESYARIKTTFGDQYFFTKQRVLEPFPPHIE